MVNKSLSNFEKKTKKLDNMEKSNFPFLVLSLLKFVLRKLISKASFNVSDSRNCCILNSGPEYGGGVGPTNNIFFFIDFNMNFGYLIN